MTTHKSDSIEDRRQKPWAMVEIELLREPTITPQCKALYGLLITYGPQSIFPGQDTLAKCLGTSRQTVKRWLDDLKLQGLIDWDNRTGTSNKYYILGYANFKRGDVTPTLQGCNTSVTGDVTPTLHDLDPLILNQELERPPLADSPVEDSHPDPSELRRPGLPGLLPLIDAPQPTDEAETAALFKKPKPPSHEPVEQKVARLRDEYGITPRQDVAVPTELAAVVEKNRAAVAHPDGGDASKDGDPWDVAYNAFVEHFHPGLDPVDVSEADRRNGRNKIAKLASGAPKRITPEAAAAVMVPFAALEKWLVKPSTTPFMKSWAEGFKVMLVMDPATARAQSKRNGGASGGRNSRGAQVEGNGFRAMPAAKAAR